MLVNQDYIKCTVIVHLIKIFLFCRDREYILIFHYELRTIKC